MVENGDQKGMRFEEIELHALDDVDTILGSIVNKMGPFKEKKILNMSYLWIYESSNHSLCDSQLLIK